MEWQRPVAEMMEIDERIDYWSFDGREMTGEQSRRFGHLDCFDQSGGWRVQLTAL